MFLSYSKLSKRKPLPELEAYLYLFIDTLSKSVNKTPKDDLIDIYSRLLIFDNLRNVIFKDSDTIDSFLLEKIKHIKKSYGLNDVHFIKGIALYRMFNPELILNIINKNNLYENEKQYEINLKVDEVGG